MSELITQLKRVDLEDIFDVLDASNDIESDVIKLLKDNKFIESLVEEPILEKNFLRLISYLMLLQLQREDKNKFSEGFNHAIKRYVDSIPIEVTE